MFATNFRMLLASSAFLACVFAVAPLFAEGTQVPQTAAEHEAVAKNYKDQAAQYKKASADHKQMAAEYAKQHADFKGGVANPWNTKIQKHCLVLAKDFEKLATDAEQAAEFHMLRAKELQGK